MKSNFHVSILFRSSFLWILFSLSFGLLQIRAQASLLSGSNAIGGGGEFHHRASLIS